VVVGVGSATADGCDPTLGVHHHQGDVDEIEQVVDQGLQRVEHLGPLVQQVGHPLQVRGRALQLAPGLVGVDRLSRRRRALLSAIPLALGPGCRRLVVADRLDGRAPGATGTNAPVNHQLVVCLLIGPPLRYVRGIPDTVRVRSVKLSLQTSRLSFHDSGKATQVTSGWAVDARYRTSLQRLRDARDAALAATSVPTHQPARRWMVARAVRPAVDVALWQHHVRYARHQDASALAALVDHYRPYAEAQARRHYRRGEPIEDLTQIALEGLLLALRRFRPERQRPFLAFAKPTVSGMIRRHFRDAGWSIRVPRRVHELATPVRQVRELLAHDLGRDPTTAEVADFVGVTESEVLEVLSAEEARLPASLDAIDPVSRLQTEQVVGRNDAGIAWMENRTALRQVLTLLTDDDRELLRLYFVEEQTQTQIAEVLKCSQMQVSRLLARAIRRLRQHLVGS
jgi:RNA polymerase sigma-B factor